MSLTRPFTIHPTPQPPSRTRYCRAGTPQQLLSRVGSSTEELCFANPGPCGVVELVFGPSLTFIQDSTNGAFFSLRLGENPTPLEKIPGARKGGVMSTDSCYASSIPGRCQLAQQQIFGCTRERSFGLTVTSDHLQPPVHPSWERLVA